MKTLDQYPLPAIAEGMSQPEIIIEGQRVLFDKKVSLLPANVRKVKKGTK